jgi:type IV secretion system protein VirD4
MQVFGVNDQQTARQISDMLGQTTVTFRSMGHNLDSEKSGISHNEQHTGRPLLTPDEVRTMPAHSQILFLAGKRPVIANKISYYREKEFQGLFDNDNNSANQQTG